MPLSSDPNPHVEELKRVHLQCCVWCNALKPILSSLNIECYGWKVKGNYNAGLVEINFHHLW